LLATAENLGLSIDYDGMPAKRGTVQWSSAPSELVTYIWFTIALTGKCIEVHDMEDFSKPLQSIPFTSGIEMAKTGDRNIVVAAPTKLMLLTPVAFEDQVSACTESS
jgi:hypothetical protein